MKRILLLPLSVLLLISAVLSCYTNEPSPDPGFGPNGEARVLSLTALGVQTTDVVIDQTNRQITISLPTSFSADYLSTRLRLTPDTRIIDYTTDSVRLYAWQSAQLSKISVARISGPSSASTAYQVTFRQNGPLSFQTLTEPLSFTINPTTTAITLPVYNYLDGEPNSTLTLTNKQSGQRLTFGQYPDFSSTTPGTNRLPDGALGVRAYFNPILFYESGDYTAELTKPNGRQAVLSQPVRIVRGALQAYFTSTPLQVGQSAEVYVANLRSTDQPSLVFRSRGQSPVTIQPASFLTIQPGIKIGPITNLQPGYYYVQLLANGQPTTSFNRVVVQQGNELVIEYLYRESTNADEQRLFTPADSFETPVIMIRGQRYVPTTNAYTFYTNGSDAALPRFAVFTSLTNPSQSYSVALVSDRFTLPDTVPPGRYQFLYRLIRPDGSQMDSIPFERDILIQ